MAKQKKSTSPANRAIRGDEKTRFKPGQSGNPQGRPKAQFGGYIRDETREGKELVDFMLSVFRNSKIHVTIRMEALKWLTDRGWGKVALPVGDGDDGLARLADLWAERYK